MIVAFAMVLGGGGSSAPGSELLLEIAVALAAAAWLVLRRPGDKGVSPIAMTLAALVVVVPLVQLIPLPSSVWQQLPGRGIEAAGLGLVDAAGSWMPWTVSSTRTGASLFATIPAALVICLASALDRRGRGMLQATIGGLGIASLLLGALQLADGSERTWRFYVDNPGYLNGFQANRNAEADVLLIAAAAFVCALAPRSRTASASAWQTPLAAGGGALLLLGCVLTGSRAGIVLIVPVLLTLLWHQRAWVRGRHKMVASAAGLVSLVGMVALAQSPPTALRQVADRFTLQRDVRADLWRDTLPALTGVWPAGSGVGTFRPLFEASEPLTAVDPTRPVRAHNDYLEFALEGGVAAVIVLGGYVIVLTTVFVRAARRASGRDWSTLTFAAVTFVVIALHSFVDYPLRSMALAILGAAASGLLVAVLRDTRARDEAWEPELELQRG
jgi:O-antigen ligase